MQLIKSEDNILYAVKFNSFVPKDSDSYITWTLVPIAVYDYVDVDYSDVQGWLQDIGYTGELDYAQIVQYVYTESLESSLQDFGYEFINVKEIYIKEYSEERAVRSDAKQAVDNAFDLW